jgi:hypothetical protein
MLHNHVLSFSDLGSQLLHIFSLTFLWQRWASYKEFLKEYEQKTITTFCWASFDGAFFDRAWRLLWVTPMDGIKCYFGRFVVASGLDVAACHNCRNYSHPSWLATSLQELRLQC